MRWRREQRERDLERELCSHLELETEEQHQSGLPEDERVAPPGGLSAIQHL
jgi:hypothetical protein